MGIAQQTLRRAALLLWAALGACRAPTDVPGWGVPSNAEQVVPPPVYARWWSQVERCAGRTAPFAAVRWHIVRGAGTISIPGDTGPADASGYFVANGNHIVLSERAAAVGAIVRHEMLHALLGAKYPDHPAEFFGRRCAGWVECPDDFCVETPHRTPLVPAGAPVVSLDAVELEVEIVPEVPSRGAPERGLQLLVRVRNASDRPVRVDLRDPSRAGATPGEVFGGFGYRVLRADGETSLQSLVAATLRPELPLAAGGERVQVFDFDPRAFPAGTYLAEGVFNRRSTRVLFRLSE